MLYSIGEQIHIKTEQQLVSIYFHVTRDDDKRLVYTNLFNENKISETMMEFASQDAIITDIDESGYLLDADNSTAHWHEDCLELTEPERRYNNLNKMYGEDAKNNN
jgi:hypothetical protein